jgi:hypothetical protein
LDIAWPGLPGIRQADVEIMGILKTQIDKAVNASGLGDLVSFL